ncbi:hypothetical protein [Kitasatospora sp. CB01950]|uniref:hypothetical protein n=1 Tax=Kitasatospora sp. CB01950 TaxID=1703930 RepID=UPI00093C0EF4|nr:hypothetical protein [Kitasatospora sp. CB01950]OKI99930.1 hypothetical protein AMK19_30930 [Kitasatospora sp. CB01950]
MLKKPGLTHDEHVQLGQVLAGIRNQLGHERTALLNAYPQTGTKSAPAHQLRVAIDALDKARYALENAAFAEHPEEASKADYFPPTECRAVVVLPEQSAGAQPVLPT